MLDRMEDMLMIGLDKADGNNIPVLIIGRKNHKSKTIDILNAFEGQEAMELYLKLVTPVEEEK